MPADPTPTPADRTERHLAMLARLAEIGMEIAEEAGRQAPGEAGKGPQAADPALSFARTARAVRLTIALEARLAADRLATRRPEAARRRDRIHTKVERALEAERDDADEVETLATAAWEQLTETDDADLLDRPIHEVVARICADLGLSPAWAASAFGTARSETPDGAKIPVILGRSEAETRGPSRRDGEAGPGARTGPGGWVLGSARAPRAPPEDDGSCSSGHRQGVRAAAGSG
jgi:hypothetical protein